MNLSISQGRRQSIGVTNSGASPINNNNVSHITLGVAGPTVSPAFGIVYPVRAVQPTTTNAVASLATSSPSPDEIVINGRGRRSLPIKWSPIPIASPQKLPTRSDFLRTPSKGIITLRSSPRKRLQMTDTTQDLVQSRKILLNSSPASRRQIEMAASLSSPDIAINQLSQKQLVGVLNTIMESHPEIKDEVAKILPEPLTLKVVEEQIIQHKNAINEVVSQSHTSAEPGTTNFCKAMPHLFNLKKLIQDTCKHLVDTHQWACLLEFGLNACSLVRETPIWNEEMHNNFARNSCFKILAQNCLQSLQNLKINSQEEKEALIKRFKVFYEDHEDMKLAVDYLVNHQKIK